MGLPLFAPMVAVTWLAVRALYPAQPRCYIYLDIKINTLRSF